MLEKYLDEIAPKIRERGFALFAEGNVAKISHDKKNGLAVLEVKSQDLFNNTQYNVHLSGIMEPRMIATCTCPYYRDNGPCKHIVAGIVWVQKAAESEALGSKTSSKKPVVISTSNSNYQFHVVSTGEMIKSLMSANNWSGRYKPTPLITFLNNSERYSLDHIPNSVSLKSVSEKEINLSIYFQKYHQLQIHQFNGHQGVISCACNHPNKPCVHMVGVLIRLYAENNFNLLQAVGTNLDEVKSNFLVNNQLPTTPKYTKLVQAEWELNGAVKIAINDPELSRVLHLRMQLKAKSVAPTGNKLVPEKEETNYAIQYFLAFPVNTSTQFTLLSEIGKVKKNGEISKTTSVVSPHACASYLKLPGIDLEDLKRALQVNELFGGFAHRFLREDELKKNQKVELDSSEKQRLNTFYVRVIKTLAQLQGNELRIDFPVTKSLPRSVQQLPPFVTFSHQALQLSFSVNQQDKKVSIQPIICLNGQVIEPETLVTVGYGLFICGKDLYHLTASDAALYQEFGSTSFQLSAPLYKEIGESIVIPLLESNSVEFVGLTGPTIQLPDGIPSVRIYLSEANGNLQISPAFVYRFENELYEATAAPAKVFVARGPNNGEVLVSRKLEEEEELLDRLVEMHPWFEHQRGEVCFELPEDEVMKGNWFLKAYESWNNHQYEVLGQKELKKLRYSPHRPKLVVSAGSGIDWFDLQMKVSFGAQNVTLSELRKAILNGDQYIRLGDGSMGVLPKEWIEKYALLLKTGKVKGEKLQFNSLQYGLVDELYDEIDQNEQLFQHKERLHRLKNYQSESSFDLSINIKATLRDYQIDGFRWMRYLQKIGWGGCLADDMGLGKTLQAIALCQAIVDDSSKSTILIVVPTSLIFNWQMEVAKFAPGLSCMTYTGGLRTKNAKQFEKFNMIFTTYGLVRQDIEVLREFEFDCVILDESQAIKNPLAKAAKAVKLLKTKHRVVMTGTPIENNTFDLYSQFDFINPGMLGSIESFRENFATPIDKFRDQAAAAQLRRLIYPFMLTRKKADVAKELPPKTETVLYCEMGPAQRKVYDQTKIEVRKELEQKISTDGLAKSGMYVLQGLLKLRQVCNSPQFVDSSVSESVKIQLLMDNLKELAAENHKVLVFSFFVQMLELVKEELQKENLGYAWISGQTTDRQAAVNSFKSDPDCKVFLISLKAGGFGLNLTEADYVFLIDPWWNPAAEQQAIDRAHRIGQDKHIFAYKMVCRDTIEEKILQLQEKKKAIADELVNIEQGNLRKMDKNDILALFS